MPQWLNKWNTRLARLLWVVVLIGIVAALPVIYARVETETSAKQVAIVMDYRDLLMVSNTQANPQAFVEKQLMELKQAGVNGMAVFESTLEELSWAGEVIVYNAAQAALLEQRVAESGDNGTYVLFNSPEHAQTLRPIIEWAFQHHGAEVASWSTKGREGLRIGLGYDDALLRPMQPNPIAMKALREEGFQIIPRLSDRFVPYDDQEMGRWMKSFEELGVTRVVFDGDAVTGFGDESDLGNLKRFANQLRSHKIGIAIFENLKVPQKGINKLASLLGFDTIRSHPIGEAEMMILKTPQIEDRLVLAVKDRNIRLLYLNATTVKDAVKGQVSHPFKNIVTALQGDEELKGAVSQLQDFGFELGEPHSAEVHKAPQEMILRGLAALGAFALIALTIGLFFPSLLAQVLVVGGVGAAGLYVLSSTVMIQALVLFAAIAAPTASVILLVRRLRQLRVAAETKPISGIRRLGGALLLFVRTTVLSLAAVPFMTALLNDITYSLVIQQFRGVGLLHMAPIGLVALYVFLYGSGNTVIGNAKKILAMPLTVLWIVGIGLAGVVGMYYLSRTGNAGQVSGLELQFRSMMENAFGVRPRIKEFMLGHPLFLVGIFLALRYRWAMVLLIPGTIAQLSMVDTFAHIHTPFLLSLIRVLLGLGIGTLIGLGAIAVWQVGEGLKKTRWLSR
ncbi:DUF5693 family protein [Cohnella sp.]|uniref:DUF5693 family protein n=1 Tax=Cohnella sp. TaxID=1883426 RepID=UPI0035664866